MPDSVNFWRVVDGKIAEQWYVTSDMDFYKQLGVIKYKGFSRESFVTALTYISATHMIIKLKCASSCD